MPEEAGNGGFERFGWGPALLDDETLRFISQAFQRADAFLFGRRTYEIFAGSWAPGQLTPFNNRRFALTACLRAAPLASIPGVSAHRLRASHKPNPERALASQESCRRSLVL